MEHLFELSRRLHLALSSAGIDYRIVGGVAVFLLIEGVEPAAARLTRDLDIAVSRADLTAIAAAVSQHGFRLRHTAGMDLLEDVQNPGARNAIHLVMIGEKVRRDYLEKVPASQPPLITRDGIHVAPVIDLLTMKLTSFRLKDQVHIQDMDGAGLITREIEQQLPAALLDRLTRVRQQE